MGEELLVFAFDVLAKIRVVRCVVADSFGRVFGFVRLKTEEVLHREFELRFAILAAAAVLIYAYSFFERGHGIEDRIDDNLTPCEVSTQHIETAQRTANQIFDIVISGNKIVDYFNGLIHMVIDFEWAPLDVGVVFAEIRDRIGVNRPCEPVDVNCFHFCNSRKMVARIKLSKWM